MGVDPQHSPQFLAGHATVTEAAGLIPSRPLLVAPDATVAELAERLAQQPSTRTIAVVDEGTHLVGVIPVTRLVDDLFLRVAPEVFLRHILDPQTGLEELTAHTAQSARALMVPPVFVTGGTTVREAFRLMREHHLGSVPIVDEEHRVTGELDLVELLILCLQTLRAQLP